MKKCLLDPEVIKERLEGLKQGFASNAIEGNPLTETEKHFLEFLVRLGFSDDEITEEIINALGLGFTTPSKSPFNITGVKTKVTTQDILDAVKESRERNNLKAADKEELILSALLDKLKKSTKEAHDSLDRGLANLNDVLDELARKRAKRG